MSNIDSIRNFIISETKKSARAAIKKELEDINARPNTVSRGIEDVLGGGDARLSNPKGIGFANLMRCLAAANGDATRALEYAEKTGSPETVQRALGAGTGTAGGFLVEGDLAAEVIDLLRAASVVRKAGPLVISAPRGTKEFPKLTASATAGYVAENGDIPASEQTFGSVTLSAKKLAALVPVSNELIQFATPSADQVIRNDLIQVLASVEDQNFLRGDGTQNAPLGLLNQALPANVTASNGATSANVEADFKDLIQDVEGKDVPLTKPVWFMNPRSKNHLLTLRDAINGALTFPEIRGSNPTLFGWPVLTTTHIPVNLGAGTNETEVYFVDMSQVLLGEIENVRIEVSRDAAYLDSGSVMRSAFTRDQTVMRIILQHDIGVRHPEAVAIKNAVTWGA